MASKKELKALITLAGKVDPSLQSALLKASAEASKTSSKLSKIGSFAANGLKAAGKAAVAVGSAVAAGIGAGVTALGGLAMSAAESADTLLTLKDKTGLSVEELQRLQYITGQLGANFNAIPQAISIMTKYMDTARKGSKEAQAAFQALGIQITDSTGKLRPQSQVFQEAIIQLSKIESEADRNALAFKLFGRGAADLFPILNAGTEEIKKLVAEADTLGLVLSEDTLQGLDNLGDTIDKIKMSAKGLGNRLIAELIPKVQPILDSLVEKIPAITSIISGIGGEFLGGIADILPQILDMASQLVPVITPVLQAISKTLGPMLIDLLQQALPIIMDVAQTAIPLLNDAFAIIMSLIQPILADLLQLVRQILPVAAQLIKIIFAVIKPFIPVLGALTESLLPPIVQILEALMPLLDALTPIIQFLSEVIAYSLGSAIQGITPIIQLITDRITYFVGILSEALNFIINVFTGNWSAAWENIKNIFKSTWESIVNVLKGLINAAIGALNTFFKGINKVTGVIGKVVGVDLQIPEIPKLAKGGFTTGPSIAGEAGPEAVIPIQRTPRSLSLLNQTARMIGAAPAGGTVNITYSPVIYGGNRAEIEPLLEKHKEELLIMIEDLMEEKVRVAYGY